jgi:hypothetical protein
MLHGKHSRSFHRGKNWRGDRAGEERSIKPWIACKLPGGPKHPQMSITAFTSKSSPIPHSFAHWLGGKKLLCKMHTECHDAAHTIVSMLLPCLVLANVALGSWNNTQKREGERERGQQRAQARNEACWQASEERPIVLGSGQRPSFYRLYSSVAVLACRWLCRDDLVVGISSMRFLQRRATTEGIQPSEPKHWCAS